MKPGDQATKKTGQELPKSQEKNPQNPRRIPKNQEMKPQNPREVLELGAPGTPRIPGFCRAGSKKSLKVWNPWEKPRDGDPAPSHSGSFSPQEWRPIPILSREKVTPVWSADLSPARIYPSAGFIPGLQNNPGIRTDPREKGIFPGVFCTFWGGNIPGAKWIPWDEGKTGSAQQGSVGMHQERKSGKIQGWGMGDHPREWGFPGAAGGEEKWEAEIHGNKLGRENREVGKSKDTGMGEHPWECGFPGAAGDPWERSGTGNLGSRNPWK